MIDMIDNDYIIDNDWYDSKFTFFLYFYTKHIYVYEETDIVS